MIRSPYETKFTREQREGKKNPSIDMENKKASQRQQRFLKWQSDQEKAKNENS